MDACPCVCVYCNGLSWLFACWSASIYDTFYSKQITVSPKVRAGLLPCWWCEISSLKTGAWTDWPRRPGGPWELLVRHLGTTRSTRSNRLIARPLSACTSHIRYDTTLSPHSTTPTTTPTPTRPTRLHPYVRHARFPGEVIPVASWTTFSRRSSRGCRRECRCRCRRRRRGMRALEINVRLKAGRNQLSLPHGTKNNIKKLIKEQN